MPAKPSRHPVIGGGVEPEFGSGSVAPQAGGEDVVLCVYVQGLKCVCTVWLNAQNTIKKTMKIHMWEVNPPVGRGRATIRAGPAFVADARPVFASAAPVARARRGGIALRGAPT